MKVIPKYHLLLRRFQRVQCLKWHGLLKYCSKINTQNKLTKHGEIYWPLYGVKNEVSRSEKLFDQRIASVKRLRANLTKKDHSSRNHVHCNGFHRSSIVPRFFIVYIYHRFIRRILTVFVCTPIYNDNIHLNRITRMVFTIFNNFKRIGKYFPSFEVARQIYLSLFTAIAGFSQFS